MGRRSTLRVVYGAVPEGGQAARHTALAAELLRLCIVPTIMWLCICKRTAVPHSGRALSSGHRHATPRRRPHPLLTACVRACPP